MKYRLLDLLKCVEDGSPLRLQNAKVKRVDFNEKIDRVKCVAFCAYRNRDVQWANLSPTDCTECYAQEIIEGELISQSGATYRIEEGIPRLLSRSTADFLKKNKRSFSLEWKYFRFGERNWGQGIHFRRDLLIQALGSDPEALRGGLILDAGCGSGLLSMEMADTFGMEVIALDLATGIDKAYKKNTNPYLYFIQASVLEPPLKARVMDYIYCAGVLIHLPNTKEAFGKLTSCLKTGGRYFIWVYHPVYAHARANDRLRESLYHRVRTRITSRLPIAVQECLYSCVALLFLIRRTLWNLFSRTKETRTYGEKMQNLIDTFSPMYVNRHTEDEVFGWYRESGLGNVAVAYTERYGFGVRGDLLGASD